MLKTYKNVIDTVTNLPYFIEQRIKILEFTQKIRDNFSVRFKNGIATRKPYFTDWRIYATLYIRR